MSTFDLVCAKCGLHTIVAEQGKAGLKYRCRGCGTILEVPGSEHTEVPGGGEIVPPPLALDSHGQWLGTDNAFASYGTGRMEGKSPTRDEGARVAQAERNSDPQRHGAPARRI